MTSSDKSSHTGRYNKANGLYQKALQLYQYVIDKWPDAEHVISAKVGVARSNIALGNEAAAEAVVNELIADFNDNPELPTAIFMLGEEYYNKAFNTKGDPNSPDAKPEEYYRKALAIWERIITELPPSALTPQAYYSAAGCYQQLGQLERAIQYCQKVVNDWPNYQKAWLVQFMIARCYEELEKSGRISTVDAAAQIRQVCEKLAGYPDPQAAKAAQGLLKSWGTAKN